MNGYISIFLIQLINPFIGFVKGLMSFDTKWSKTMIFLFLCFYSYTFIPIPNSDATKYETRIERYKPVNFNEYISNIVNMYSLDSEFKDAYIDTVSFLLGRFTNNPRVYRLVYGMVYYAVFLSFLSAMRRTTFAGDKLYLLGLGMLYALSSGINGVRWPLALMTYLTGIAFYIERLDVKYLLLCALSIFIHFSLIFMVPFLLIYLVLRKSYKSGMYILYLLIIAFFVLNIDFEQQKNILGYGLEDATSGYVSNNTYKEGRANHLKSLNWYVVFNRFSTYYFGLGVVLFSIVFKRKIVKTDRAIRLELLALLFYFGSFISASFLDVLSNRYYLLANAISLMYCYVLSAKNKELPLLRVLRRIYVPILLLNIALILRADSYTFSPILFFGNWLTTAFDIVEVNMYELLN